MASRKVQKTNIDSESEMPPMKKKDFFEMVKNNDEAYSQEQSENIKLKAVLTIKERQSKALAQLLEKEKAEKELLQSKLYNMNAKNEKSSSEYMELMKKQREKRIY